MKTLGCFAVLLCLLCAVLLAQAPEGSAAAPQTANKGKQGPICVNPNPASGYAASVKLGSGKSTSEIIIYDVDRCESSDHHPICVSQSADDRIFWARASGGKFKIKISPVKGSAPGCRDRPFLKEPPPENDPPEDNYFSGSLDSTVPGDLYCVYEVEFKKEGPPSCDPHIQKTP